MMFRIMISLTTEQGEALYQLSKSLHRDPREQAAYIICQELEMLGFLAPTPVEIPRPAIALLRTAEIKLYAG